MGSGSPPAIEANKLIVRDADTGAEKHAFEHGGAVLSVAFSPDGKWLAAGDSAKKLIVRDADTGAEKHAFEHGGDVSSVAFSPDGKWLAAGEREEADRARRRHRRGEARVRAR